MRSILLGCFFTFFLSKTIFSQDGKDISGKIIYEVRDGGISYLDMWFSSSKYLFQVRNQVEIRLTETLPTKRQYKSLEDSLLDQIRQEAALKMLKGSSKEKQTWYGELGTNKIHFSAFIDGNKKFCVTDSITLVNWEMQEDTATINGIFCQKATLITEKIKDKIIAWFAPSIPASVAPWNMRGLPGLLIKITNETKNSGMEMLQLEWPVKQPIVIQPPCENAVSVTRKEFNEIVNNHNAAAIKMAQFYKKELEGKTTGERQGEKGKD